MMSILKTLDFFTAHQKLDQLSSGRCGIEKEGLRYTQQHQLSTAPHPTILGHSLTHERLTTDFAESLLELVTPAMKTSTAALTELNNLHHILAHSQADYLLNGSMPAYLDDPESVAIGYYGESNSGKMRRLYRQGLAIRYGKAMQLIAGIHYNYSFSDALLDTYAQSQGTVADRQFVDNAYLNVIRNIRQFGWITAYLFGHSPALDASFLRGKSHCLESLDGDTLCLPYATSLRLSDIGYQSKTDTIVRANRLDDYLHDLRRSVLTPSPTFAALGLFGADGKQQQMNTHLLQIENEYYTAARPKQITEPGEAPLHALQSRGIAYVELRTLDINCFAANGISQAQLDFLTVFMVYCLFNPAPALTVEQEHHAKTNLSKVACCGRDPSLTLTDKDQQTTVPEWGNRLLDAMLPIAIALDEANKGNTFIDAINEQKAKFDNAERTPAAHILATLQGDKSHAPTSYHHFITSLSQTQYQAMHQIELTPAQIRQRDTDARQSYDSAEALFAASAAKPFARYLADYYDQIIALATN
ncbi:glutamate--cysteine ligase [Ostreibacterium oceani]|uniref:Glutamate--cysteine ligase n=1 Tax=Ostreibacterium oceani TaxID=2654998 RepID=A0A6N7ERW9_9GAMM|nr:glutamate--cysteine ligase [Ostreibacterium oceani]MPV85604.1 glutamate--cysteine ligase [Ostreibacterium oceani]